MPRLSDTVAGTLPRWRPRSRLNRSQIPGPWARWLLASASLTHRLQQACSGRLRVQVLEQQWVFPLADERRLLGLRRGSAALVRHVHLLCDGRPWVFARTVIPPRTLAGRERRLAHLGTKSLGAVLFADKTLRRGQLQLARIEPGQALFATAVRGLNPEPDAIWGRRSVFYVRGKPLLVNELFLPGIETSAQ